MVPTSKTISRNLSFDNQNAGQEMAGGGAPAPATPVGRLKKETDFPKNFHEPGGYEAPYWEEYGREIELEKELEELGIQKVEEGEVELPPRIAEEMGVKPFVPSIPQMIGGKTPLTDDQIAQGVKKYRLTDSVFWLAEWCLKKLKQAHVKIKWAKGKLLRIS